MFDYIFKNIPEKENKQELVLKDILFVFSFKNNSINSINSMYCIILEDR